MNIVGKESVINSFEMELTYRKSYECLGKFQFYRVYLKILCYGGRAVDRLT